jgi:hypothetical protein
MWWVVDNALSIMPIVLNGANLTCTITPRLGSQEGNDPFPDDLDI